MDAQRGLRKNGSPVVVGLSRDRNMRDRFTRQISDATRTADNARSRDIILLGGIPNDGAVELWLRRHKENGESGCT